MEKKSLPLAFHYQGTDYRGWATSSDKHHADGYPSSYPVVLNEVFFDNLSRSDGKWLIDEQRPHELVEAVGERLEGLGR